MISVLFLYTCGVYLLGTVLFLILAIVFRRKKPLRILFTVLTCICFLVITCLGHIIMYSIMGFGPYLVFALLLTALFLILAIFLRKKKKLCILFTALAGVNFLPVLYLISIFLRYKMGL